MEKKYFGKTQDGRTTELYELKNENGMRVGITDFGGTIVYMMVPDKNGKEVDVVLGYDDVTGYENGTYFFGALIGRCANRIGKGRFELNGKVYQVPCNDGENHLHGGNGFDKKIWKAEELDEGLKFTYVSENGEEGYPGKLTATVIYTLSSDNSLRIEYQAISDEDTLCNLTNHAYFNLAGHCGGSIVGHWMQIHADSYTATDEQSIPTGEIASVEGTPMDFRQPVQICEHIDDDFPGINFAGGFDHNWVASTYDGTEREIARAWEDNTGIELSISTTLPGVQFYSGNSIRPTVPGKGNFQYEKRTGFCLETQYFPDAINHDNFEKPIIKAGEAWNQVTTFHFGIHQK